MPIEHSPRKSSTIEASVDAISYLTKLMESVRDSTQELQKTVAAVEGKIDRLEMTCQGLDKRMKSLEDSSLQQKTQISKLKNDHDQIREKVDTIQKDMIKIKHDFSSDINEQINRYQRRLNLIIKGVPESPSDAELLSDLFAIIWPGKTVSNWDRLEWSDPKMTYPRLVRVQLPTPAAKKTIFSNCKLLKGLERFKGISVCSDMTKQQQAERRSNYNLRSKVGTSGNNVTDGSLRQKRKATDMEVDLNPRKTANLQETD